MTSRSCVQLCVANLWKYLLLLKIKYNYIFIFIIFIDFSVLFFSLGSGKKHFFFFFPICTFIFLLHLLSPKLLSLFILLLDDISHFFSSYLSHQELFQTLIIYLSLNIYLNNQEKLIFIVLWRVIWVAQIFKLCWGVKVNTFFLFSFFPIGSIKADLLLVVQNWSVGKRYKNVPVNPMSFHEGRYK